MIIDNQIEDRIVSIYQAHVRPIKRGKPGSATETGAKISASLVDGYSFLDRLGWDTYNETRDLVGHKLRSIVNDLDFIPNRSTPIRFTAAETISGFARSTVSVYLVLRWGSHQRMRKNE